jgi:arginase
MNMMLPNSKMRDIALVEAAVGVGARDPGCRDGPRAFWTNLRDGAPVPGVNLQWYEMPVHVESGDPAPLPVIARVNAHLTDTVNRIAAQGDRFMVLGGDHSCGVGTWSGAARALRRYGPVGLVWIDAHMDMHVPETTHSGFIHGMPVACLLGRGEPVLTRMAGPKPAVDPRHLCLVGVRSFEPEEMALARELGVRVIQMDEVRARGLEAALDEAHAIASTGTVGYGVSLDLDGLDPRDAPAVATPEPGGIDAEELLRHWGKLTGGDTCIGAEVVEYNPHRAGAAQTEQLMRRLIAGAFDPDARP